MTLRTLTIIFFGLCVLLAPVLGNAALSAPVVPLVVVHGHAADCHPPALSGCHAASDGHHALDGKATHDCCFSFVGVLPDVIQSPPLPGATPSAPFRPALRLTARVEELYRPPRQIS